MRSWCLGAGMRRWRCAESGFVFCFRGVAIELCLRLVGGMEWFVWDGYGLAEDCWHVSLVLV